MAETTEPAVTDENPVKGIAYAGEDGEHTFVRPGIESKSFKVRNGKIAPKPSPSEQTWLLEHVAGTSPVTD